MKKFIIVDIETTGNSPKNGDRMIQFAAVIVEKGAINNIFTTYINPEIAIPPFISELTGIEDTDVAKAPVFADVADQIRDLFEDACFVAHNVHFDLNFLQEELKKAGKLPLTCPYLDTVELSRIFMPTLDSYKLSDLAAYAGFDHDRPHQADSDALVTAEWFLTLVDKALQLPIETLNQLKKLSFSLKNNLFEFFELLCYWKHEVKEQNRDDLEIFNGIALKKWQPQSLVKVYSAPITSEKTEMSQLLERGYGQSYERRLGQLEMADTVSKALKEGDIAFIEAEPGFGKTVSYLLPAALTAIEEKMPVVVSVHTIQKQNEISEREIPHVEKMLDRQIFTTIVKGRRHYLNLWNFERLLQTDGENYDETITKMQILVWLTETETGDGDELNLSTGGMLFWQRLAMEEITDSKSNPWKERDFFARVVKRAKEANIIITNHHFLMADLTGKQNLLPEFNHIIIDEAHHFERNTAKYFGNRISYRKIKYLLNQLGTVEQNKLIGNLLQICQQKEFQAVSFEEIQRLMEHFTEENGDFFQILLHQFRQQGVNPSGRNLVAVSLTDGGPLQFSWERYYIAYREFFSKLEEIYRQSLSNWTAFNEKEKLLIEDFANCLYEFVEIERFHQASLNREDMIFWAETDDRKSITSLALLSQPLEVGKSLVELLFTKKKGILFISNSLTVQDSFQYVKTQLGLNEFPVIEKKFTTSVSEENRPNLYILEDMPEIKDTNEEEYTELVASSIISLAESIKGRVLILFTSHEMLKNTYFLIKESGALEDHLLLAQGISSGSVHRLSRQFNRFSKALLLGSYTFWEGADIDRELLSAVIMVRLPFTSPNNPIHRGKNRLIKNRNGNSFYEHSLPEAVIRFKQGIGKLFYSKKKKGSIIVFDRRLQSRTYGKIFLQSIPTIEVETLTIGELCQKIEERSLEEH